MTLLKTNHIADSTKIILLVATVIVVCLLCITGFKLVNEGKSSVTTNSNKLKEMSVKYTDVDLSLYEGSLIHGSELVSLIKSVIDENQYLAIEVKNLSGDFTTYNYVYLVDDESKRLEKQGAHDQLPRKEVPKHKQEYGYINPMALFLGSTFQDSNGSIVCIHFEQQP